MSEQALASFLAMIPLGRVARPDELAAPWSSSPARPSSYVTGAVLNVSGGQLMY
jgi:NAD(P)-dependent dehydrogenase (short-subunit alcohol dehydrogenase family)